MDIDVLENLPKLTPLEQARCFKEGLCLQCQKPSHNAKNCRKNLRTPQTNQRQYVANTETTPVTTTPAPPPLSSPKAPSALETVAAELKGIGIDEKTLIETIRACYYDTQQEDF